MSRNLCRTNCRTCEGKVVITGLLYQLPSSYWQHAGMWVCDAECKECGTKYSAWVGPTVDSYGWRYADRQLVVNHGFYDLSYRSTFNDEPGPQDLPEEKIEVFRVVRIGGKDHWTKIE